MSSECYIPPPNNTEGLKWSNAYHLLLMALPNIFHPKKLARNLRHPIGEVLHTRHNQYSIGEDGLHVVEHLLFGRLVTVDVVKEDRFVNGIGGRLQQLFRPDFYYGHGDYFPHPFRLVDRTFVDGTVFDYNQHLQRSKK